MIVVPSLKICYQAAPKVGTTTMYTWLADCAYKPDHFKDQKLPPIHTRLRDGKNPAGTYMDIDKFRLEDYPGFLSFAITRDPVRRFLSAYSNRVLFHKEMNANSQAGPLIEACGLKPRPEINHLVDNLEAYFRISPSVYLHARPMVESLGRDPARFHHLVDISKMDYLVGEIRSHFRKIGRSDVADTPLPPPLQTGGPKLGLEILTPYSFEVLLDYYKEDYATLPTVDLAATKSAYFKARESTRVALAVRVAEVLAERKASREAREAKGLPARTAGKGRTQELFIADCPVAEARIQPVSLPGKVVGSVLLRPDIDPSGWKLIARQGEKARPARWQQPSPSLAKLHPGNPNGENARFTIGPVNGADGELVIELVGPDGKEYLVAKVGAKQPGKTP